MLDGEIFKNGFNQIMEQLGQTIIVHKNWGQPEASNFEVRGLKNSEKNIPHNVIFQFNERINLTVGSVLQLKGGSDLWRVVDTEDHIVADTYVSFKAKVVKIFANGEEIQKRITSQAVFNAPIYGGVQIGGERNIQNISLSNVVDIVAKLDELLKSSSLPELEKEDAIEAISRIPELAKKEQSGDVLERVKTRLDIVKSTIEVSEDIAKKALPLVAILYKLFKLGT